jgi:hypothetical protein
VEYEESDEEEEKYDNVWERLQRVLWVQENYKKEIWEMYKKGMI